ncbi:MAG: hypothetical protein ACD_84C00005G0003 [uncultured bacterium]|nr:MAG: hypothetical protein ACD_84C00005G0003 [uncultured bacterium]
MNHEEEKISIFMHRKKPVIPREPLRNVKEVISIFNFTDSDSLWDAVTKNQFPKPDIDLPKISGGTVPQWKFSTVQKEQRRRKNEEVRNRGMGNLTNNQGERLCAGLQVQ